MSLQRYHAKVSTNLQFVSFLGSNSPSFTMSVSKATDKAETVTRSLNIFSGHLLCSRPFVAYPENRRSKTHCIFMESVVTLKACVVEPLKET